MSHQHQTTSHTLEVFLPAFHWLIHPFIYTTTILRTLPAMFWIRFECIPPPKVLEA
jgi:hypothetical protein